METEDRSATKRGGKKRTEHWNRRQWLCSRRLNRVCLRYSQYLQPGNWWKALIFPLNSLSREEERAATSWAAAFLAGSQQLCQDRPTKQLIQEQGPTVSLVHPVWARSERKTFLFFFFKDWTKVYSMKSSAYCCTFGKLSTVGALWDTRVTETQKYCDYNTVLISTHSHSSIVFFLSFNLIVRYVTFDRGCALSRGMELTPVDTGRVNAAYCLILACLLFQTTKQKNSHTLYNFW